MLTLRQLIIFIEVCKNLNMTRAAEKLYISQPAISKTIKEIEEQYNIQLFERSGKALKLTRNGEMLYSYSSDLISLTDKLDEIMRGCAGIETIRVGASITVGTSILSGIISEFRLDYPDVVVSVVVDNTDVIDQQIADGLLDIAIIEEAITNPKVVEQPIGSSRIVLVVSKNHPIYDAQDVTVDDLRNCDFIVREPGSKTRELFSTRMSKLGVAWHPLWECHNTQTIKNAVEAGFGIGVLSELSVRRRLRQGIFKNLDVFSEPLELRICLAYNPKRVFKRYLEEFREYAVAYIQEMSEELQR